MAHGSSLRGRQSYQLLPSPVSQISNGPLQWYNAVKSKEQSGEEGEGTPGRSCSSTLPRPWCNVQRTRIHAVHINGSGRCGELQCMHARTWAPHASPVTACLYRVAQPYTLWLHTPGVRCGRPAATQVCRTSLIMEDRNASRSVTTSRTAASESGPCRPCQKSCERKRSRRCPTPPSTPITPLAACSHGHADRGRQQPNSSM